MPLNGATYYAHWDDDIKPTFTTATASDTWDIENYVDFNATDAGSGITGYNVTTSTTAPTTWIPVVDAVEPHTETKYQYDAAWARVFHQNTHWGEVYYANANEAKSADTVDKYSVLGNLNNYRNNSSKYEFLLQYPLYSTTQYNRWIQTANPVETTINNGASASDIEYSPINISWNGHYWGGLAKSTSSNATFLDGSPGNSTWYYAIGVYYKYHGSMPGLNDNCSVANLWSRIDQKTSTTSANLTRRLGDLTSNQKYYVWVKDSNGNTNYKDVTISKVDTTKPTASIASTNNVSTNQTATLTMGDNVGAVAYYWGTSNPTTTNVTWTPITSTTSTTINQTVSNNGTYYLGVKDAAGNAITTNKTFYKTTLTANKGTVTPDTIITMAGNSFNLPNPSAVTGYTFSGWYTAATGGTKYNTSYTPTGNLTIQGQWVDKENPTVTFGTNGNSAASTTASTKVTASDTGSGVKESALKYLWSCLRHSL